MKLIIVLTVLGYCAFAAPIKDELLRRASELDTAIKAEIKTLKNEKREHLALALEEEEKRLDNLADQLKNVSDSDEVHKAILDQELINLEFRIANELSLLKREAVTQEFLESNAKILKQWVTEEISALEKTEGQRNHVVARALRREEQRLEQIAQQLTTAQNQRTIETLEVELRAIEVRLYEALRTLHFKPTTPTAVPVTGSTRPVTASETTTKSKTANTSTARSTTRKTTVTSP